MRRPSRREAMFQSSHAIAEVTRRLQATLNLPSGAVSGSADEALRLLARARAEVRRRRAREAVFGRTLFSEPAWEVLLELFLAQLEGRVVTVKGACMASRVPQTTALRYINNLIAYRLVHRLPHPRDNRSSHLQLTDEGLSRMRDYFNRIASDPAGPGA